MTKRAYQLRKCLIIAASLLVASLIWLPCIHLFYKKDVSQFKSSQKIAPIANAIANTHLAIWNDADLRKDELDRMQFNNPEWDFMFRTYFVLALANMALIDEARQSDLCLIMDAIIDNTLAVEKDKGFRYFLLPYGKGSGWVNSPESSVFVDGEIALMIAARQSVRIKSDYREILRKRIAKILKRMKGSPIMCDESYPDECWLFCNTVGLAAIRIYDYLEGEDHSQFFTEWVLNAKEHLVDDKTNILISAFTLDGKALPAGPGPEGSSIWMACHMLQIIDSQFAQKQYKLAKKELSGSFLGFGYAREFPADFNGTMDVDSGPIIPVIQASLSSSGLAILAAASFGDDTFLQELLTSVEFVGMPKESDNQRKYLVSNPVGDSVLLYALMEGPLWKKIMK